MQESDQQQRLYSQTFSKGLSRLDKYLKQLVLVRGGRVAFVEGEERLMDLPLSGCRQPLVFITAAFACIPSVIRHG